MISLCFENLGGIDLATANRLAELAGYGPRQNYRVRAGAAEESEQEKSRRFTEWKRQRESAAELALPVMMPTSAVKPALKSERMQAIQNFWENERLKLEAAPKK